ncbi:hypothetical protein SLS56_011112 [Neofusicoccum ribis]|uniref:Fungal STAND N-terminal Goodbye domain-containing protein n=1 Tax=Neofusicoccum ribis TaxID=45134 RepID=A0ABR3SCK3_9PEZI
MESELGDERLQELWRLVVKKYEDTTNEKLEQTHELTVEEMQERLSDISREGKGEIVKKSAETVFSVAQYAAEAASTVFPYASTVFGALTAIKSTVEDYRENFTKKRVLEKLDDAALNLTRIQAYMKMSQDGLEIDAALKASIVQLFTRILMLCMIYQKVEKDSRTLPGRAKNLLKAAIGYDGGIASHLSEIGVETDREISNNVAALRVSDTYAKNDRNLKKLQGYLEIGEAVPSWVVHQKKLESAHIEGMGEWLHKLPAFASWSDVENHSQEPVLVLRAGQGHGKSHLCSQVIHLLGSRRNAQHQNVSTSIAWYFFPKSGGGQSDSDMEEAEDTDWQPEEAKKQSSLRESLIALTWQLAQSDRAFQEHAARQFHARPHGFSKAVDIWNEVIFKFIKDSK